MTELHLLKAAIVNAIDYMAHDRYCDIDQCDVCTCQMLSAKEELRMAFNAVRTVCTNAQVYKCRTSDKS